MLGRKTTVPPRSSQLRAQMSVGTTAQGLLHSAEAQHLKQSVPGRSAFESKRHATVYSRLQIADDWLHHWVRAWWHVGEGEDRGCNDVGLRALFNNHSAAEL